MQKLVQINRKYIFMSVWVSEEEEDEEEDCA